jgi:hypothetical protein
VLFIVLLALSCGAWTAQRADQNAAAAHQASAFDYSWYLEACTPHLDGSVYVAEAGAGPYSLANVAARAGPGATIVLLPGKHDLGGARSGRGRMGLRDVWLVGAGAETTQLSMELDVADRVRIDGVTVVCNDNPVLDIRDGGSLWLRGCKVTGYNSGAGGENAIFGSGLVLLVEDSEVEGKTGRASGSRLGRAFDLRGENRVFLRGDRFVDNEEVFRNASGVFDHCTVTSEQPMSFTLPGASSGGLWVRSTNFPQTRMGMSQWGNPGTGFMEALDDLEPLKRLSGGAGADAWTDVVTKQLARRTDLKKGVWTRLLLHPLPEVRGLAAARLKLAAPAAAMSLEEAFEKLDKAAIDPKVALAILGAGEAARKPLQDMSTDGLAQARANASALLRLLDVQPPLPEVVRAEEFRPQ